VLHYRRIFLFAGLAYLTFVVYGSLVPLDFHPRPIDAAVRDFLRIRYLRLGTDSRADWVANILLYIPLPILWLSCLSPENRFYLRAICSLAIFIFCIVLSLAIEFAQLFFPPRTVSLNDISAEIMGSFLGVALWWASGKRLRGLIEPVLTQGRRAAYAGLVLYAVAYLAFSLFPYDFLISIAEIQAKLNGEYFHWLASSAKCGGPLRCGMKLMVEASAVAPLGLLLALTLRDSLRRLIGLAMLIGFGLGLTIETLQIFLVSGLTLGASVITRVVGVALGAAAGYLLKQNSLWPVLYLVRPIVPVAAILYVMLLAGLVSVGKGPMLTLEQGVRRLNEINYLPFFYHYYTSESAAMTSLLGVVAMFIPIGIQYWIWRVTQFHAFLARGAFAAAFLGWVVCMGLEFYKLFLAGARPDPTNVVVATLATAAGFLGASICAQASLGLPAVKE
jgi:VanZ family protein